MVIGLLLLAAAVRPQDLKTIPLLNLKSHWTGNGVSHFTHDVLRLLSPKLSQQCGQISSYTPLPGGSTWSFTGALTLHCQDKAHAGLTLLFVTTNLIQPHNDYSCDYYADAFGTGGKTTGVGVTLFRDNIYVSIFEEARVSREQLIDWATPCKIPLNAQKDDVGISVRYRDATFSVYAFDRISRTEALCAQFANVSFMEEFYLVAAGADAGGQCAGTLTFAELRVSTSPEFIEEQFKTPSTPEFASYQNFTSRNMDVRYFHRNLALQRQHAKIVLEQLLRFADKSEKEVVRDLSADYEDHLRNLTAATQIIERETEQLTALSQALLDKRQARYQNSGELLSQVIVWLESVEGVYEATTNATRAVYEVVAGFTLDDQLTKVMNHTQKILLQLKDVFKNVTEGLEPAAGALHGPEVAAWNDKVSTYAQSFNSTVQKRISSDPGTSLQSLGTYVLGGLALLIFGAFGFLYWKVNKAAEFKRIL